MTYFGVRKLNEFKKGSISPVIHLGKYEYSVKGNAGKKGMLIDRFVNGVKGVEEDRERR